MSQEFVKQRFKLAITQVLDVHADTGIRVEFQYIQAVRWRPWLTIEPVHVCTISVSCDCGWEFGARVEKSFLLIRQDDIFLLHRITEW